MSAAAIVLDAAPAMQRRVRARRLAGAIGLAVCAALTIGRPLRAQVSGDALADSAARERDGATAGRRAANRPRVEGRFAVSFVAGLSVGFVVPLALDHNATAALGVLTGSVAVIGLAGDSPSKVPLPAAAVPPVERDGAYRAGYERDYRKRLAFRRRRAALAGGGVGVVTGLGLLVGAVVLALGSSD